MALTKKGNKVIAKLTDLTQESTLNDGDRIVFWCNSSGEASTIDYSNVRIDLDHTTFGDTFNQVVNFATTASAWVSTMTDSFNDLDNKMNNVLEQTTQVNNEILAIKMMVQMIIGLANTRNDAQKNFSEDQYVSSLPEEAKAIYNQMKQEVLSASGTEAIDFSHSNLIYISST